MFKNLKIRSTLSSCLLGVIVFIAIAWIPLITHAQDQEMGVMHDQETMVMADNSNFGLIWSNTSIMFIFDIVFILILMATIVVYFTSTLRRVAQGASVMIICGLGFFVSFFVLDAYSMFLRNMVLMSYLHGTVIWFFILVALLFFFGGFWMLARGLAIPLSRLKDAVVEIARGNMDVKIDTSGKDEIAELSRAIDKMRISIKAVMHELEKRVK